MARPQNVDDETLIAALSDVFRAYGFEGASLSRLAEASGLQKASLYHRFPGGKQQMAEEVLSAAYRWLDMHVLGPLAESSPPAERLRHVSRKFREFYECGLKACLLNMLSSPSGDQGPFAEAIKGAIEAMISALAALARDAGQNPAAARRSAETAVVFLQGSLVVARGLNDPKPFERFLAQLPKLLLRQSTSIAS